jgi:hypothetical protein
MIGSCAALAKKAQHRWDDIWRAPPGGIQALLMKLKTQQARHTQTHTANSKKVNMIYKT